MDEVKEITFEDLTPEQMSELTGVDGPMAEFILAVARGECPGDVTGLDYSAGSTYWRRRSDPGLF